MDYETLRQFADSWGLLFMVVTFLVVIGWAFRPGSRSQQDDARMIPFRDSIDQGPEGARESDQ
ncbi:cbb3-type cytochrome oxidase subunit 3 [Sandaracinobacteroides sp. A072]|uniref:cbb3-type cytochrome oxidase subunit 3 n=1 Tax=Sandaracinobacteroides sp. A072 TaxID=3461146 RepID=UPI00404105EF